MYIYGPSLKKTINQHCSCTLWSCEHTRCKERRFLAKQTEQTTFHQYAEWEVKGGGVWHHSCCRRCWFLDRSVCGLCICYQRHCRHCRWHRHFNFTLPPRKQLQKENFLQTTAETRVPARQGLGHPGYLFCARVKPLQASSISTRVAGMWFHVTVV